MTKKQIYNNITNYLKKQDEKLDHVFSALGGSHTLTKTGKKILKSSEGLLEDILKSLVPDEELEDDKPIKDNNCNFPICKFNNQYSPFIKKLSQYCQVHNVKLEFKPIFKKEK